MDYKDTLLMPKTAFPMRGNLPNKEPDMQKEWEDEHLYEKQLDRTKDRPLFVLHDGPPYANGDIHIGHAENKILKDMIVRFKSMSGYQAPYVPGWDTHGLPIEQALTKKGVKRKSLSIAEFRKLCEEYALEQIDRQRTQFKRLGVRGDWDHPYVTLHKDYEAEQIKVFGEMAKKGYIYKDKKTVYWSPSSESALAEAEIEYQDKRSPSIYVAFNVKDGKGVLAGDEAFVIWTTTPWTIPANMAIAVNPAFEYSVVDVNQKRYIVASELLEGLKSTLNWEGAQVLKTVKGRDLEFVVASHPFYDRDSLVILGDHVTLEAGTGCVHTAPGHGEDDYYVGKKYNLEVLCPVDEKGVLTAEAPGFEGLFYDAANKPITEKLEEVGALLKLDFFTHSYPHDWRTKKPIIFRATEQWFASIKDFRSDILEAIKHVKWVPNWGETRLHNMVRDREDWCISRQRVWGVPIPVFYGEDGEPIITDETIQHISDLFREHGSNIWFEREAQDLLPDGFTSEHSPNGIFTKETDIMDVWFDSGSSHQAVLEQREDLRRPADLYLEGSDQYRGWFNSSLSTSVAVTGKAPYKGVLSHGFVLDGKGHKMSKSLGNVIDPTKVMKQLGADIIRLWVSSVDYTADARVSQDILKQVAEVYRKIRNTLRFLLGNLHGFDPAKHFVKPEARSELDRYMTVKLNRLISKVMQAYNDYQFLSVYNAIHNYCTIELSAFYMDIAKDTLYVDPENSHSRRSIQSVLYQHVTALTKMLTPIIPHTTEEVWQYIPGEKAEYVQLTDMPEEEVIQNGEVLVEKWDQLMAVRDDVLKALETARNEKIIGKSLEAAIVLYPTKANREKLESVEQLNKFFIVSQASIAGEINEAPADAQTYRETAVIVKAAEGEKCERCWVVSTDVGTDSDHPTLCASCAETVKNHYA
ncbi:isoleucine--tRNA ligase 1 [Pullulanibacillus camelliae]|uniref:Isoleucine--tRNA ligase n=1 Tax=Pullulanibacillus camelliae TaxID=1707096 RepID=A0A8J2YH77_9BACL|nr:isoleucine--tRNA ligase [Pullulanibacillus camelliae]GGE41496.1 isoleucine--tRNA ligase 1 [Pullulanibacillus camelliae]